MATFLSRLGRFSLLGLCGRRIGPARPRGSRRRTDRAARPAMGVRWARFVVRMTLVPAVLALLGRRAWRLPRWLDRLVPDLDIEGERLGRSPHGGGAEAGGGEPVAAASGHLHGN
ncbi:hypothetical protein [Streptomyces sp. NPDC060275]|uniref:hypothetical protein n=1 Tax=Streptomyces sp. NPDC060275 TaxID=3347090 RepID=UPI00364838A4